MLARDFIRQLDSSPPPRVVLLCPGKAAFNKEPFEPWLAEQAVAQIVEKYVDPSLSDLVHSVFYADETPPGTVALEAQTLPFLAERRCFLSARNRG